MVERISGWVTPGGPLRGAAQRKPVGGLSRGRPACQPARSIAVWRPLLPVIQRGVGLVVSLTLWLGPVAIGVAVSSDQPESQTPSQTSDPSDPQSAIQFDALRRPQSAIELVPGMPIERELAGGEAHAYRVTLAAGQYLHVVVDQRGIDVMVKIFAPDGQQLAELNSQRHGLESVSVVAKVSGIYRLKVLTLVEEAPLGSYEVRIEELRATTPQDETRAAAERILSEGVRLYQQKTAEYLQKAIEKYEEALSYWRALGDRQWEAITLTTMGQAYGGLGEYQTAQAYMNQALPLHRVMGNLGGEAETLHRIGTVRGVLGEYEKALEYLRQALPLRRAVRDRVGEGATLNNIALSYGSLGEYQKELEYLSQALDLTEGSRHARATILSNIGNVYNSLGEPQKSLDYYNQALALFRAEAYRGGEADTLSKIGDVYNSLGEPHKALDYYGQALPVLRVVGHRVGEAQTLDAIGATCHSLGEYQKALNYYGQSLQIRRALGDRVGEAQTLNEIGAAYFSLGEHQNALETYGQALLLSRDVGDRAVKAAIHFGVARLERNRGNFREARTQIEAALDIIESLRTKVPGQELRASYLASKQDYYEFYVDLLMRQHQREPSEGHDATALHASERARARSLLETLAEARADIRQGVDPAPLERERSLQQQLNAKEQYRMKVLSDQHTDEQAAAAEKEVRDLLTQYQEVQAQIRTTSPRYAALTQPQPLSLKEIQQQVLDDDTLLLEYALGEERGFLWAVTPTSIKSYELPKRAEIEAAARRVYELMSASNLGANKEEAEAMAALSQMLVGPVADQLGKKRLLIVSEGALQYVPFGALPAPKASVVRGQLSVASSKTTDHGQRTTDSRPLIVEHEIVHLPSASVLAVLRRELAGRPPSGKLVAVLADPVFSQEDERVKVALSVARGQSSVAQTNEPRTTDHGPQTTDDLERAVRDFGNLRFDRLRATRREAEGIVTLAREKSLKAVDFQANRATATSAELSQYRLLHFATHGLLNSQHPELSGVVLSLVDEQGRPQDGFLRLHEIYNLKLGADLVVLSACQTALGKEIKGEGLVRLTRGFMYAGVPRVVASLWRVPDKATAELMKRFYQGMLREGLTPAAALRAAQVSLWKERRWRQPYYWAAFVLQGEWR